MDRRVVKTKENIKGVLKELLLSKNYSEITVKEIASIANIERKTFYLHYGCIEDVINELLNDSYLTFNSKLNEYITKNNGYDIHNIFSEINQILLTNIDLFKRIAMNDSYSYFRQGFEGILKAGILTILENAYHITRPNRAYYATFFASGITKLYIQWLSGEIKLSIIELEHILTKACFASLDELIINKS